MSLALVQALHDALARTAQEREGVMPEGDASVLVQFAAGDYAAVRKALKQAKVDLDWKGKHAIADAAGVPSHEPTGGVIPVDTRIDMAAATLPADEITAPPGTPAPAPEPAPETPAPAEPTPEPVPAAPAPGSPPDVELPPA